jgi:hypothetical protein
MVLQFSVTDGGGKSLRARLQLTAVIAAFVLPLIIAALLASGRIEWFGTAKVNAGRLLNPTIALADTWPDNDWQGLPGYWRAVVVGRGGCAAECRQVISDLNLLRLRLGRKAARLQILYFGEQGSEPPEQDGELNIYWCSGEQLGALQTRMLKQLTPAQVGAGSVFLLDWRGELMMAYAPGAGPDPIARDVDRLFKTLRID